MLTYALTILLAVAHAQNATTTSPSTITASASVVTVTASCTNDLLQNCQRAPQYPFRNSEAPEFYNNYQLYEYKNYTPEETSLSYTCAQRFFTSMNDYLSTAPITPFSTVAETTLQVSGTFTSYFSESTSTGTSLQTTVVTSVLTSGQTGGDSTTVITFAETNGFKTEITETLDIYTTTTEVDIGTTTTVPYTTVTASVDEVQAPITEYSYVSSFAFTASPPCCSSCSLFGNNVQVYYWPSTTAAPNASSSTLTDSNGFTL